MTFFHELNNDFTRLGNLISEVENLERRGHDASSRQRQLEYLANSIGLRMIGVIAECFGVFAIAYGIIGASVAPLVVGAALYAFGHDCILYQNWRKLC